MQLEKTPVALRVLNPKSEIRSIPQVSESPRLRDLNGKKIAILDNTKHGGEMLLPYLEEALKRRVHDVELRVWRVPFPRSQEDKDPKLKEIAEYADGVIALMGD